MKTSRNFLTIFALLFVSSFSVFAQYSTTDTLQKGQIYVEGNLWTGVQNHRNGGMQVYGGRFSVGTGKGVEIGLNGSFSDPHNPDYPPEIQPNVKWKFYNNEKAGVTASGGVMAFLPVGRRSGTDAFAMTYANVSKSVKKMNGARFTVGGYALLKRNRDFGSRKGWNLMYEQPLTKKVSFSTQWMTGSNRFGYVTPGFSISLPKNGSLYVGYSIGNAGYDNHGPYISLGFYRF